MNRFLICITCLTCAMLAGCGNDNPPLARVSGRVTLDGQPLAGVIVNFKPDEGRMATGTTDQDGNYSLEYSYQTPGAPIGINTVMLEWPLEGGGKAIPKKYTGITSEIKKEVKAGSNTINLDLSS